MCSVRPIGRRSTEIVTKWVALFLPPRASGVQRFSRQSRPASLALATSWRMPNGGVATPARSAHTLAVCGTLAPDRDARFGRNPWQQPETLEPHAQVAARLSAMAYLTGPSAPRPATDAECPGQRPVRGMRATCCRKARSSDSRLLPNASRNAASRCWGVFQFSRGLAARC